MLDTILAKVFGTQNERELKQIRPLVEQINALEASIQVLSDEQLRAKTVEFRSRVAEGAAIDDLLRKTGAKLWIQHDILTNATLKKSPQYYD